MDFNCSSSSIEDYTISWFGIIYLNQDASISSIKFWMHGYPGGEGGRNKSDPAMCSQI